MTLLKTTIPCAVMVVLLGACQALYSSSPEDAPYWPRFQGSNADNISTDTGLLTQWPEGGPRLIWTVDGIGEGFAGVVMANGMIYTAGNVDGKMTITALDMDGNMRWQIANGDAYEKDYPGARGTPTLDGDRLYHESPDGRLACFNAVTGKEIWSLNILDEFDGKQTQWALAESILIDGDRLICCPGGAKTAVVALDKMTGKTVWKSPSASGDLASYASPTLIEYKGLRIILTMTDSALIGVNADNGELLFQHAHPTKYKVNALMPVFRDGHILTSSGYGTTGSVLVKLDVDGDKASVEQVWQSLDLDNHHGGVVVWEGHVYGAAHSSGKSRWVCLDWKTGETKYSEKGVGKGPVTFADGMLYTMSENRDVGLVKATPESHDVISRFEIPRQGKGKSWAHPVVCGGRLYIRHGDYLYAYDVKNHVSGP
ncbi:MAG TPA: hypothetical protein DD670_01725 [Planctomycetaceae bacterium]|nr:hypothetical protein [Planctomycetaceae bacterium]